MVQAWEQAPLVDEPEWKSAPLVGDKVAAPSVLRIDSDLPKLDRRILKDRTLMAGRDPMISDMPESDSSYKKRLIDYYGFTSPPEVYEDEYNRLQELAGFTPNRQQDLARVVKKAFGDDATLAIHSGYPDPVIQFKSGEIVPFNIPGVTTQDIRGLRAGAGVLGAEIAGGAAGLLGGPLAPVTVPLGVGAGAYISNVERLEKGKEMGLHDLTDAEIKWDALIDAGIASTIELTTLGLGRFLRGPGKAVVGDLTEAEVDAITSAAMKSQREGEKITVGQAMQRAQSEGDVGGLRRMGQEARTLEEALIQRGEAPELRGVMRAQEESLERETRKITGDAEADLTRSQEIGQAIQDEAEATIAAERQNIRMEADIARAEQEDILRSRIEAPQLFESGEQLRGYLQAAKDDTFQQLSNKYEAFYRNVPEELPVDIKGVKSAARSLKTKVDDDLIKRLTEEDVPILDDIIKADDEKAFETVSRAISQLKAEQRAMSAGLPSKTRQKSMVNDLIDELSEARDNALRGLDDNLVNELRAIDESYAEANREIYGSLLGRLIAKDKQGGVVVNDDALFEKLARSPGEVRRLTGLINNPEYAGFGGTSVIKDGFYSLYRDKVVDGRMTHAMFMDRYGRSMDDVFTTKEMQKFDSFKSSKANIDLITRNEKDEIKRLQQEVGYKLQGYDAEDVLKKTKDSVTKLQDVKKILRKSPDKWEDFKRLYVRDFLNSIKKDDGFGPSLDANKLSDRLKKDRGELTVVLGNDYVKGLKWLQKQANLTALPKSVRGQLSEIIQAMPEAGPVMNIWRGTLARPLSRAGLLTTAAVKQLRKGGREAFDRLLSQPENLKELHNLHIKDAPLRKWRSFFRSIGYNEAVDVFSEKEE
jgi:hypothetical protein